MRAALSVVLATALVTTPLKLVLAQAAQQDSTTVHTTSLGTNPGAALVIRIPEVTAATAALWQPMVRSVPIGDSFPTGADLRQDDDGLSAGTVVVIVLGISLLVLVVAIAATLCAEQLTRSESACR